MSPRLAVPRQDGRLLIVLGHSGQSDPRQSIGQTGMHAPPVLGADALSLGPGGSAVVDASAEIFPIANLSALAVGEYEVQAVFHTNRDLDLPDAPGNCYSKPVHTLLDVIRGGTVKLELTEQVPAETLPADTAQVRYLKLPSRILSQFHGRPMFLRAGIILPRDFDKEPERRYPLRVHIGGYGSRFTNVQYYMSDYSEFRKVWQAEATTRMIFLHLDGGGPYGDPYQVNSANNGPYGDAITQELIPYVEQKFRGIGQGSARTLDGGSTGGWVSLALQVFYPEFFNGTWSQCPDPVDFRAYELIDVYRDDNAYVNAFGFERPAKRNVLGDLVYTVRHECQLENVLGRRNRWWLSGKDWCAWNATFGPRGGDGLPRPLWDGKSGKIDRSVVEHWKKYDLRRVLEGNWATLGPKLRGKIHIWVGDADDYFLNNAVHRLDQFLSKAQPAYEGRIEYAPGKGHTTGWHEPQLMEEMAAAVRNGSH